tara:strand:+ start:2264 stop:3313 length:1050 start_codon:yes stop_codon:yes gene_type:complete
METTKTDTMRRWVLKAGETTLDGLKIENVAIPEPGPGQVRIKMKAASINYRDQIVLQGMYGGAVSSDIIPLSDGAGIIDKLGENVTKWHEGDKVTSVYTPEEWADGPPIPGLDFGLGSEGHHGVLAEYIILNAERIALAPEKWTLIEAATIPCAALTAWTAVNGDRPYARPLTEKDKVLGLGTGGVSLFSLLFAKAAGAEVIGTSSQQEKLDKLSELGITNSVNYSEEEKWGEVIFDSYGGASKVINTVGGSAIDQTIAAVEFGGEIAFMGLFDYAEKAPNFVNLMMKGASIRGTAVGSTAAHLDLVDFINTHDFKPPIHKVFPFKEAVEAYKAATSKDLFGKIVIEID